MSWCLLRTKRKDRRLQRSKSPRPVGRGRHRKGVGMTKRNPGSKQAVSKSSSRSVLRHPQERDDDGDKKNLGKRNTGVETRNTPISCYTKGQRNRTAGKKYIAHPLHPSLLANPNGIKVLPTSRPTLAKNGGNVEVDELLGWRRRPFNPSLPSLLDRDSFLALSTFSLLLKGAHRCCQATVMTRIGVV